MASSRRIHRLPHLLPTRPQVSTLCHLEIHPKDLALFGSSAIKPDSAYYLSMTDTPYVSESRAGIYSFVKCAQLILHFSMPQPVSLSIEGHWCFMHRISQNCIDLQATSG